VQRTYPRNSVIIKDGDGATSLYIALSGRLKVYRADADGKEFILDTLSEGDHFGPGGARPLPRLQAAR
jgi:CRP/FNR family cyclic AMP-dependent transcriptional regulator